MSIDELWGLVNNSRFHVLLISSSCSFLHLLGFLGGHQRTHLVHLLLFTIGSINIGSLLSRKRSVLSHNYGLFLHLLVLGFLFGEVFVLLSLHFRKLFFFGTVGGLLFGLHEVLAGLLGLGDFVDLLLLARLECGHLVFVFGLILLLSPPSCVSVSPYSLCLS